MKINSSPNFRLAGKKFGHPAGVKKILQEIFEPKTMKLSIENLGNREIVAR